MWVWRWNRLLLLALLTIGAAQAQITITSVGASNSLNQSALPSPLVTGITSGTPRDGFYLYITGSFPSDVSFNGLWLDPTVGQPVSLQIVGGILAPDQVTVQTLIALVGLPQFQTTVKTAVPVGITVQSGDTVSNSLTFFINPPLAASASPLPFAGVGVPYSAPLSTGGTAPYAADPRSLTGTLPQGTSLTPDANGVSLAGTPTAPGQSDFGTVITDYWGNALQASYTAIVFSAASVTSLSQTSTPVGSPDTTITVNGTNFYAPDQKAGSPGSLVQWKLGNNNTVTLATQFVSATQLQATIPTAQLQAIGSASIAVLQPSNASSNALPFAILPPVVTALNPPSAPVGSAAFTLSVSGTSFLTNSVVSFNSTALPTTFVNATTLRVTVPANLVAVAGNFPVAVTNPGNVTSLTLTFQVLQSLSIAILPSTIAANSPAFKLTVTGQAFTASSVINFKGTALTTAFGSSTVLTTTVPTSLIQSVGGVAVTVVTPNAPATTPAVFTVTPALAITTSTLGSGGAGQFFTVTMTATGGNPPLTWSASGLPPGVSINPQSGVISGPVLQGGTFNATVTVQDSVGGTAIARYTLVIAPPPVAISTGPLPNGQVGVAYVGVVGASGGSGPYTFSVSAGSLPGGLSLKSDGSVLGTPTTPGTFSFSVDVHDSNGGSNGRGFTVTIIPAPLVVTAGGTTTTGTSGTPINIPFGGSGGVGPYRCTVSGITPPGTTFSNCTLSGTPNAPGTYNFRVTITDSTGASANKDITITIAPPALTLSGSVGNGKAGVAYSGQLAAAGGTQPYTYSISGLPDGLSGNASGAISGTPTTAGQFSIGGSVTDSTGGKATVTFNITIAPADLVITTTSLAGGTVNSGYSASVTATGGVQPYTFTIGGLPDGLTATSVGAISGTPTTAGSFTVSVTVKDSTTPTAATATKQLGVTIAPAPITITTASVAGGTVGTSYSATLAASGGVGQFTWSATGLPAPLTISSAGVITGTPAAPGSFNFTATVKDGAGTTASKPFPLTIALPPSPPLSFSGIGSTAPPLQQPNLQVSIGTAYPVDVVVTLTLTFAADSGPDDPSIQFSTGGRTARITIPAGSTVGANTVGVQTGTVAGTITITGQMQAASQDVTPTPAPRFTIRIAPAAPVLTTVTATRSGTGFTVTMVGFVTDREVTQAIFTFNAAAGSNLQTTSLTVPVDTMFAGYFGGSTATPFGGQFNFTQSFSVTGNVQSIVSVTVTLINKIGQSTATTVNLN